MCVSRFILSRWGQAFHSFAASSVNVRSMHHTYWRLRLPPAYPFASATCWNTVTNVWDWPEVLKSVRISYLDPRIASSDKLCNNSGDSRCSGFQLCSRSYVETMLTSVGGWIKPQDSLHTRMYSRGNATVLRVKNAVVPKQSSKFAPVH